MQGHGQYQSACPVDTTATESFIDYQPRKETTMTSDQVAGIVRAIIAAVGGYLVGKGITDAATVTAVGGAVATIVAAVWSVLSKKTA